MAEAAASHLNPLARDFLTRLPQAPVPGKQLHRTESGAVVGDWFGFELSSAFQPIVDAANGAVVGREAFLRSHDPDEHGLSPWTLFSAAAEDARLIALDRLARTVHLLNALAAGNDVPLFLNVHGRLLAAVGDDHGRAFRRVVDALGVQPDSIVIETPPEASAQPDLLAFVLRNYRANGFRVAVNVESAAQWQTIANTVWPQFVKVDRRKLGSGVEAHERLKWLAALREDARIIVTHVEEPAPELAADHVLLQGYAYGHPVGATAFAQEQQTGNG
ncbi:EAL domain-containing protein [Zoogloea sp. LCSB751]|uniref:EAL domain-containing protein n=1 Tax=Zoogloea sp. LCSB751 TaxID=1965277 RepID=UPI0009A4C1A7|nr:EAL domain-containing protein [Zoogloea sp. LCSB751]